MWHLSRTSKAAYHFFCNSNDHYRSPDYIL